MTDPVAPTVVVWTTVAPTIVIWGSGIPVLLTEDGKIITTEDGQQLEIET